MARQRGPEQWLDDLNLIWRMRLTDEMLGQWRKEEKFVASAHLCVGQEAIAAGALAALNADDPLYPTYRGHGWAVAKGVPPAAIMGELLGRQCGVNHGRAGSAMFSSVRHHFYPENAIIGAGTPIAAGAALAIKQRRESRVVLTVVGDGAMNQGATSEAMNFAAYQNLPLIFICENNRYSELTPIDAMVKNPLLFRRATGFGMPGERVDGNDTDAVFQAVAKAAERARAGQGPSFIEALTERLVGHYTGDAQLYRPKGEVDDAKTREPVAVLTRKLRDAGIGDERIAECERRARIDINDAAEEALASPLTHPSTAMEHLYA